jgi:hypothetical protein
MIDSDLLDRIVVALALAARRRRDEIETLDTHWLAASSC